MKRLFVVLSALVVSIMASAFAQPVSANGHAYFHAFQPSQNAELTEKLDMVIERVVEMDENEQERIVTRLENGIARFEAVPFISGVLEYVLNGITGEGMTTMEQGPTIVEIASSVDTFSTLVAAVSAADLVDTLNGDGPFTVFAPGNDAFTDLLNALDMTLDELVADKDLLTTILTYHVVPGDVRAMDVLALPNGTLVDTVQGEPIMIDSWGNVTVNDISIVDTDIVASNGVIHVIDEVLLPPSVLEALGMETDIVSENIVEVAIGSEMFPTLVSAVVAAELDDDLQGNGPFTVYAPTEEAFAQLLSDLDVTAEDLLADTELLTEVLLYHVVSSRYDAADVLSLESPLDAITLQGSSITIDANYGAPTVNGCNIVQTDIDASNGIIHVIDCVLVP